MSIDDIASKILVYVAISNYRSNVTKTGRENAITSMNTGHWLIWAAAICHLYYTF